VGTTATISTLFTDLVDSTALMSRLGPEEGEALRKAHYGVLRAAVAASGGTEVKSTGDGLMVVFDSVSAALGCAVAIQQGVERHGRVAVERLAVRIGVSHGEADLADGDYYGRPVIEAARLCAAATGGQILTTELVRVLVGERGGHGFSVLGERELKGLPGSVSVWAVAWSPEPELETVPLPLPGRLELADAARFVGREPERARLLEALTETSGGARRVVLVNGEAGIGKTSLMCWLACEAQDQGVTVLYGRCDEELVVPYWPWREALGHLVEHAPELVETDAGVLAPLLGGAQADRAGGDPESERFLLYTRFVEVLGRVSAQTPVLVVLDDLHWADGPTVALLRHVVATSARLRVLVVGTFRDAELRPADPLTDALATWHREVGVERIALGGLGDLEVLALLESLAGHEMEEAGVELRDALQAETDGNPFFTTEILRHLSETGVIYQDDASGRWMVSAELGEQGLPVSVREVIGRRVARLGDETRRALGYASVIGRDFDLDVLGDLMDCDADAVLDLMEPALERAVVLDVAPGRFSFRHALIEHALYDELTPTRRARAHGLVATALEARFGDDPGARSGELAYHWALASTPREAGKAIGYAIRAGDFALAQLAPDEARRWHARALELLDQRHPDGSGDRAAALVGLGDAQRQLGDAQYRATLVEAGELAAALGDTELLVRAALATSRGVGTTYGVLAADVVAVIRAALVATEGEVSSRRAKLLAVLAAEEYFAGNQGEPGVLAGQAIELARTVNDDATLCWVASRAELAWSNPENVAARVHFDREIMGVARRLGDPVLLWFAALNGLDALVEACELDEADALLTLADELGERIGQPYMQWANAMIHATRAMLAGTLEVAEAHALRAFAIGSAGGQPDAPVLYGAQLAGIRFMQGREAEIIELLAQGVADHPDRPVWRALLAASYARLGRDTEATEVIAADIADDFRSHPFDATWTTSMWLLAETLSDLELADPAAVLYTRLTPFAANLPYARVGVGEVGHHALGRLATVLGRYDDADAHFRAAADTHQRLHAPYLLASTRIAWADMLTRRANDDDPDQAHHLAQQAAMVATQSGYGGIERRAQTLLTQLS
jgi:class 3 adenylate cyclase